jgi:hypothetical protein
MKVAEVLNNIGWDWDTEIHEGIDKFWSFGWTFLVADSEWRIILVATESRINNRQVELSVILDLFMMAPRYCQYHVIYHPGELWRRELSLDDLLESSLRTLFYLAGDLYRFVDLAKLMGHCCVVISHDRRFPRRVDVIMDSSDVPYFFAIIYHVDAPFVAVDYGIISKDLSSFGILKDAIVEEYWDKFVSGGGR